MKSSLLVLVIPFLFGCVSTKQWQRDVPSLGSTSNLNPLDQFDQLAVKEFGTYFLEFYAIAGNYIDGHSEHYDLDSFSKVVKNVSPKSWEMLQQAKVRHDIGGYYLAGGIVTTVAALTVAPILMVAPIALGLDFTSAYHIGKRGELLGNAREQYMQDLLQKIENKELALHSRVDTNPDL